MNKSAPESFRRIRIFSLISGLVFLALLLSGLFDPGRFFSASMKEETASLLVPNISATLQDSFADADMDGKAAPGETVTYTAVINNTGTDATGVQFSDTLDAVATLVPGSLHASPIANNETFNAVGNTLLEVGVTASGFPAVKQTGSVLNNDTAVTDTISVVSNTNPANGSVTLNSNGTFSYLPNTNFTGNDTFTYTIQNNAAPGLTDTATVSINVSSLVWYVNNSGANGDGRSNSPFNNLTSANTASGTGDIIFIHRTGTNYNTGITLKNNQQLIGQGVDLVVNTFTLQTATSNPIIAPGSANGINLASGNTIRGLTVGNTGSGIGITGSTVGSLTISNSTINGTGEAIDINGGSLSVTFDSISSSNSSDRGIDINNVSGTFQVTGGTTITNSGNTGIDLTSSGSATFTFADLDITTTNDTGLFANAGTINSTSGTINTGNGNGVDINNATLGLTFTSISSSGGSAPGIDLNTTTGSFQVVGDGATGTGISANNGSGGTISNKTGDAVFLQNASNISLGYMNIGATGGLGNIDGNGIRAINVNGLTLTRSNLRNIADQVFPDEAALFATNPQGTWNITNTLFDRSFDDHIRIINDSTTSGLTINLFDSTIQDNDASGQGDDGFLYVGNAGNTNTTIDIKRNNFDDSNSDHIQVALNGAASANVTIGGSNLADGNTLTATPGTVLGSGITLNSGALSGGFSGTLTYLIQNNNIQDAAAASINVNLSASSVSGLRYGGTIADNIIGTAGNAMSGGFGISVIQNGAGILNSVINNNQVRQYDGDHGILLEARDGTGRLNATITNNMISNPADGSVFDGIGMNAGATGTDTSVICAEINSNSLIGSGPSGADFAIFSVNSAPAGTQIILPGYVGAAKDNTAIVSFVQGKNDANPGDPAVNLPAPSGLTFFTGNSQGVTGSGSCSTSLPFTYSNNLQNKRTSRTLDGLSDLKFGKDEFIDLNKETKFETEKVVAESKSPSTASSVWKFISVVRSLFVSTAYAESELPNYAGNQNQFAGETISIGTFTLPANKSVTIVFQATVADPNGAPQMMTQGTVSGTNFGAVMTDDPATGAANDPTVTPLALTPTAANANISGRVISPSGRGLARVRVMISGGNFTEPHYTQTNPFGYYRFTELEVGAIYVISVSAKDHEFTNSSRVINLVDNLENADFVSDP